MMENQSVFRRIAVISGFHKGRRSYPSSEWASNTLNRIIRRISDSTRCTFFVRKEVTDAFIDEPCLEN